ncbi:MAG TPA: molybdopterin molybdotransferase MoeA [Nitrospiria bacterium]|nr:molybdopterin molybdotransferase MoeA [Nitrospiria bacterium]
MSSPPRSQESDPVQEALARFLNAFPEGPSAVEHVTLDEALDRVAAEPIAATLDSPPFARAIVEGFLVNADDTAASNAGPVSFTIAGTIRPGDAAPKQIAPGTAWEVFTGSAVPAGACGVIRAWDAKRTGQRVTCSSPVQAAANIEAQGCDLTRGAVVVAKGAQIGPDEMSLIAAQGIDTVPVAARPIVGIFGSGNEVIPHTARLTPGAIWDCNTPALSALIRREGGIPKRYGVIRDDFDTFRRAVSDALPHCGMIVIAGGTAVDGREFVRDLVAAVGSPGVLVNGVPMRSGKPLIMGVAGQVPIVCVAGHPPEALRGFRLFGAPALSRLLGRIRP